MQEVNGEEEPMWPTPDRGVHSTASLAVKKDIMQGTAPDNKERGEREQELISSTSTQKKIWHTKEAKQRIAGWP
jgi:hypothetical protein